MQDGCDGPAFGQMPWRGVNMGLFALAFIVFYCSFPLRALRWGRYSPTSATTVPPVAPSLLFLV